MKLTPPFYQNTASQWATAYTFAEHRLIFRTPEGQRPVEKNVVNPKEANDILSDVERVGEAENNHLEFANDAKKILKPTGFNSPSSVSSVETSVPESALSTSATSADDTSTLIDVGESIADAPTNTDADAQKLAETAQKVINNVNEKAGEIGNKVAAVLADILTMLENLLKDLDVNNTTVTSVAESAVASAAPTAEQTTGVPAAAALAPGESMLTNPGTNPEIRNTTQERKDAIQRTRDAFVGHLGRVSSKLMLEASRIKPEVMAETYKQVTIEQQQREVDAIQKIATNKPVDGSLASSQKLFDDMNAYNAIATKYSLPLFDGGGLFDELYAIDNLANEPVDQVTSRNAPTQNQTGSVTETQNYQGYFVLETPNGKIIETQRRDEQDGQKVPEGYYWGNRPGNTPDGNTVQGGENWVLVNKTTKMQATIPELLSKFAGKEVASAPTGPVTETQNSQGYSIFKAPNGVIVAIETEHSFNSPTNGNAAPDGYYWGNRPRFSADGNTVLGGDNWVLVNKTTKMVPTAAEYSNMIANANKSAPV